MLCRKKSIFDELRSLMKERNWLKYSWNSLNIFGNAFATNYICNTIIKCVFPQFKINSNVNVRGVEPIKLHINPNQTLIGIQY